MTKGRHWSNSCARINNCNEGNCICYSDYMLWTTDEKFLDFNQWKDLILIEKRIEDD